MTKSTKWTAVAAIALTALTLSAAYDAADARGRRVQGQVATQRGTFNGQAEVNRQRGSRTRNAEVTGPNGGQRTVEDNRNWSREDGTYSHDRTTTGPNGASRNVNTDVVRTGDGQFEAQREVTGRNGEIRTQTGEFTATQTENGRNVNGTINTTNAGQIDYDRNVSHDNGVRSVNASATFEDGTSRTRSSSASCANGACSSSGVITNRNGGETSWDQSRTRTENGVVLDRDVTYPDGSTRSVDRERVGNGDGTGTINRAVTGRNGETRSQTGTYDVTRTP